MSLSKYLLVGRTCNSMNDIYATEYCTVCRGECMWFFGCYHANIQVYWHSTHAYANFANFFIVYSGTLFLISSKMRWSYILLWSTWREMVSVSTHWYDMTYRCIYITAGSLIHFDTDGLQHLCFIDPQWLIDKLALVVTTPSRSFLSELSGKVD